MVCDFILFMRTIIKLPNYKPRAMVLDAATLLSTTALVKECGVPVHHIDVVSHGMQCVMKKNKKKKQRVGVLHHGSLDTYFEQLSRDDTRMCLNVLVLDFCCVYDTVASTLEYMFKGAILENVFVMAITLTHRDSREKVPYRYYHADEANCAITAMARTYGYVLSQQKNEYSNGTHFTLFYKGMKAINIMGTHIPAAEYNKKMVRNWFVLEDCFYEARLAEQLPLKKKKT